MEQLRKLFAALMILSLVVSVFSSCKDDDDDSKEDRKAMLIAKSWLVSSMKITPAISVNVPGFESVSYSDLMGEMEDCDKDDFMTFKADGTNEINPGTVLCDGEGEIEKSTWEMSADQTKLTFDMDGEKITFTIISMTSTKIEASASLDSFMGSLDLEGLESFITIPENTVVMAVFVAK